MCVARLRGQNTTSMTHMTHVTHMTHMTHMTRMTHVAHMTHVTHVHGSEAHGSHMQVDGLGACRPSGVRQ